MELACLQEETDAILLTYLISLVWHKSGIEAQRLNVCLSLLTLIKPSEEIKKLSILSQKSQEAICQMF